LSCPVVSSRQAIPVKKATPLVVCVAALAAFALFYVHHKHSETEKAIAVFSDYGTSTAEREAALEVLSKDSSPETTKAIITIALSRESAELAKRLIEESCNKQHIPPGQLTLHADRGTSMSAKPVAFLLADLGVTKTHSRPHVSNDNPYSESQFRTLKYRPEFPDRFGCIQDSRAFCQGFFRWYNEEHRHSGLGLLTPAMVHYGQAENILRQRQEVLDVAYQRHPERFVRSAPKPPVLPNEV